MVTESINICQMLPDLLPPPLLPEDDDLGPFNPL